MPATLHGYIYLSFLFSGSQRTQSKHDLMVYWAVTASVILYRSFLSRTIYISRQYLSERFFIISNDSYITRQRDKRCHCWARAGFSSVGTQSEMNWWDYGKYCVRKRELFIFLSVNVGVLTIYLIVLELVLNRIQSVYDLLKEDCTIYK